MKNIILLIAVCLCFLSAEAQTCDDTFVDSGGLTSNFSNNENLTYTFCPAIPGTTVRMTFTAFSMEANYDGMYIHNGNSVAAPLIPSMNAAGFNNLSVPGAYWGNSIPGPFVSTSVDGCLTFHFFSDLTITGSGWIANVTCEPFPACPNPTQLTATNVTATTATFSWNGPDNSESFEYVVLPCGSPAPTASATWIPTASNPVVVTGLTPQTCYAFYVRALCDSPEVSAPIYPLIVTTLVPPLTCGNVFTDVGSASNNYPNNSNKTTVICPDNVDEAVVVTFTSFATEAEFDGLYVYNGNSLTAPQIPSANPPGFGPLVSPGAYWGTTIPGPFISTSPDGCLTFLFRSDGTSTAAGWTADISCISSDLPVVTLLAFVDENANGIKDGSESGFTHGEFTMQINNSGPVSSISSSNGSYTFSANDGTATHDINYQIQTEYLPYYAVSATFNDLTFATGSGNITLNFPITLLGSYSDLAVIMGTNGNPTPGSNYNHLISYRNNGTATVSGTLSFAKDPNLTIVSVSASGTVSNPNGFTLDFTDLAPNTSAQILVAMAVPPIPTVAIGQYLTNTVTISGATADVDLSNNSFSVSRKVLAAYDPNDINESHGPQIVHADFDSADYLYYTIRFQNTGNTNATTVRLENTIDDQLNAESVRMVHASHDYTMTRVDDQLTFQFDDIQLVPESVNNDDSQGFVIYKVKPMPGYAVGDIIPNFAEIYFDTNPAIVTNTFETEFVAQLGVGGFDSDSIRIYPNPATSQIYIASGNSNLKTVKLIDLLGKVVLVRSNMQHDSAIDVSPLTSGVYILEVTLEDDSKHIKKLLVN